MNDVIKRTFSVTLSPAIIERLDRQALRETEKTGFYVSRSRLVERLLETGLEAAEPRSERLRPR
jgi:metal-responsive CopG/Arc/MetJ family transcriptional regulator